MDLRTALMDYVTIEEAMRIVGATRQGVYLISKIHNWKTIKIDHKRLFFREHVEATPYSNKRGKRK